MDVAAFLERLEGVRPCGPDRWMARCPAHDDRRPSLSVQVADDRILIHCFAGCSPQEIVEALGLEMRDLFLKSGSREPETKGVPVATYVYTDEQGNPLYRVVRYWVPDPKRPKRFGQEAWNPKTGTWEGGKGCMARVRKVLYRLPDLVSAPRDEPVWLCEGEKDADHLAFLGLLATTNVGGALGWRPEYGTYLAGRRVHILEDNDDAGSRRTALLAEDLSGLAAEVKVIRLPDLGPGEDVTDWLLKGHTVEELREIAEATPPYRPRTAAVIKGSFGIYSVEWPELNVAAKVEGVDISPKDATVVASFFAYGRQVMPRTKVNLLSASTRSKLAKELEKRAPIDLWDRLVEDLASRLVDRERFGEPVEIITDESEYEETGYLVEPLLPLGLPSIVYGDGESGKTMLAILLSVLVSSGESLPDLGLEVRHRGPVMFLDWEGTRHVFARRVRRLCKGLGLKAAIQYVPCRVPLALDFDRISKAVLEFDPILVVVDSAALAASPDLKDPLDTAKSVISPLAQLGRTSLVIAHTPKGGDSIYGSVFFRNLARSVWRAKAHRDPDEPHLDVVLVHDKANEDRRRLPIGLRFGFLEDRTVVKWTNPATVPEVGPSADPKGAVIALLKREGAMCAADIARALDLKESTVRSILNRLRANGRATVVRSRGRRKYYGLVAYEEEEIPF